MADSEVRQKWDLFLKSLSAWKIFRLTALDGFAAGMRAGEIAMKEKAARMLDEEVRLSAYAARASGFDPCVAALWG